MALMRLGYEARFDHYMRTAKRRHTKYVLPAFLGVLLLAGGYPVAAQTSVNSDGGAGEVEHSFTRLSRIPPRRIQELYEEITRSAIDVVEASSARMYARPRSTNPIATLKRGDLVHRVKRHGEWSVVRTKDGRIGYINSGALSNTWILIAKQKQKVYVYEGEELLASFSADLAVNPDGDKEQRGGFSNPDQRRTPEGLFFISMLNHGTKFHKAFVINYPTPAHAERGLEAGIITREQYAEIVKAAMVFESPPFGTRLGGWIEIHGSGVQGTANWTDGCVALGNDDMDMLYDMAGVGTPVMIIP